MTELSVLSSGAQTITVSMPRGQNSQVIPRHRPARSAHRARLLPRLSPVSDAALRETRTTRPAAPTAATAPRTTTRTTTAPTTTPTTTVRRTTSRRPNRRLRRCTPLLLRSEPTMMIRHGIDPRAALSNVDVCHTHIEIVVCVLAAARHGGSKGKGRLCAWACACMLSLVSRRLYARPALLEQTGDPQRQNTSTHTPHSNNKSMSCATGQRIPARPKLRRRVSEQTGSKSAHQEELALDIAHHRLQPRGVELPVLAQHLRQEAAQIGLAVEARLVRVRVRVRVGVRVRVRVRVSG